MSTRLKTQAGVSVLSLMLSVIFTVGQAQTCTVNWTNRHQRIDGFGGSSAWFSSYTTAQYDMLFSTNSGIGLSLLRNHILYASSTSSNDLPTTSEIQIMTNAQARGALLWSAPWTPAAGFKSSNEIYSPYTRTTNLLWGGSYLGYSNNITNLNYASQLANYVYSMSNTYHANIYAISVQNEPDANITNYEACQWYGSQIRDFVTNLYAALAAKGVGSTKILIPESQNWTDPQNLAGPTISNTTAAADVSIIGDHDYVPDNSTGDLTTPAQLAAGGKTTWETEVMTTSSFDGSITNGMYWAWRIHLFLTAAQVNAWHYWWLIPYSSSDNEGLLDASGDSTKRMYVLGQWSRFVRPGYYRIDATNTGSAFISAFNDTNSGNFAIVAVNTNASSISQAFNLSNFSGSVTSVTPWITSATLSLTNTNAVTVSSSSFSYTLPARSVVTFVGRSSGQSLKTTTVSLTNSVNPSTYGNTVTFTATVKTNGVAVGGISGETVSFYDGTTLLGTGTLNSSSQATYTTTVNQLSAATHSITAGYPGDATYAGSTNSPALSQTVNQATLTAGLTGTVSKIYNGTTAATLVSSNYTMSGVVSNDTVTLNNPASGTYDTRNQGTGKTVSVTGLAISGASATNYTLASTSVSAAIGTITKTNITITAASNAKAYDGTTSAAATPTITSGSVQTGDTASFTETYDTKNVGTSKTLTPSGSVSDGNSGANYSYSFVTSTNGTITAATLTAGLTGTVSKLYNGTTAATLATNNYTLPGVLSNDTVTLNNPASGTYDTRNQGTNKTVTVTGLALSGASATNYTLASTSASAAVGTISQTNITVTATANGKTYDGTTNAAATPTITSGSAQTGDTASFTETYDTKNVGTGKTLTPAGSVSDGNGGTNYSYSFVTSTNGTINTATLTYTANTASKTYGSAIPALSGSVSGFVGSDTQSNATTGTLTFTTTATSSSPVGSYAINGSGLTANNGNYTFVQATGNATSLTINALPVNLTGTRPYDGTTTVAAGILSVTNKVGSDDVTVASGSGTLANKNVGTQAITSFGTLALGGTTAGNYTLSGASGYVTITAAGFTVTVTNLLALDKVYDGTTNAALDASNAGLDGVTNGDDVTLISSNAAGYFADKNAGTNKPVTVLGLTLGGAQATNYELIDPTNIIGNITPAGLAVSGVTAADKVYDGTTNATLIGTAVLSGPVVSNDDVSLVTSNATAFFADANVGTNKPVTVAGYALTGADAGDYTLAQPTGLTADIVALVTPVFGSPAITVGAGGRQLNFSAQAGQNYEVLATANLALPVNQWTILTNGTFGLSGTATFTDSSATNLAQRFYRIVSP